MKMFWLKLKSFFPEKLPTGMSEFMKWSDEIILLSNYADADSLRFAIASILIHSDHKTSALSKNYFVVRLRKSAANQVASQVFQDIKEKQKAAEVTAAATKEAKTSSVQTEAK